MHGGRGEGGYGRLREEAEAGPVPQRRAFSAPYESVTFSTATRSRCELTVTLASQPVFDLASSTPISQRLRRSIRRCGERSLFERKTLDSEDLKQIDVLTIEHGMRLLRLGPGDCGIVPAFWRTLTAGRGPYALQCAAIQHSSEPGSLLIEVFGGIEHTPVADIDEALSRFQTQTRGVVLHIAPDVDTARRLAGVQAQCLAIDFAGVAHEGARLARRGRTGDSGASGLQPVVAGQPAAGPGAGGPGRRSHPCGLLQPRAEDALAPRRRGDRHSFGSVFATFVCGSGSCERTSRG